jgi:hypothetical protein
MNFLNFLLTACLIYLFIAPIVDSCEVTKLCQGTPNSRCKSLDSYLFVHVEVSDGSASRFED